MKTFVVALGAVMWTATAFQAAHLYRCSADLKLASILEATFWQFPAKKTDQAQLVRRVLVKRGEDVRQEAYARGCYE